MAKRDPFEQKIKEKLEGLDTPRLDLDQAWQSFSNKVPVESIPFWRRWFMPYLYATSLFLSALLWYQQGRKEDFITENSPRTESIVDTVMVRDTVYLVDTVYIVKKIYVEESPKVNERNSSFGLLIEQDQSLNSSLIVKQNSEDQIDISQKSENQTGGFEKLKVPNFDQRTSLNPPASFFEKSDSVALETDKSIVNTGSGGDSVIQKPQVAFLPDSLGPKRPRSMTAPSVGSKEKVVLKSDIELVVGDTSNLNHTPVRVKTKPMTHVEGISSILFPISKLVEYYDPVQYGVQVGVEWENGWGVYVGAIYNQVEGEMDDEDILQLPPSVVQNLPNLSVDLSSLDEIYITNRQWFFPIELRWRSLYYSGFSFESSFGLMGNYLSRQDFIYEFENNFALAYQYETVEKDQLSISHLRLGIGTNYLLSKRLGMFLRSHYWFPTVRTGIVRDRVHGLEVGAGINIFLGK